MNKKAFNLFLISLLFLFLLSSAYAVDVHDNNMTILSSGHAYNTITSNLSNDDIQLKFDNANDGDTFEFTDEEYNNISLVVDKKLNIISKNNSVVYASSQITDKAKSLGIDKTFGFYFTPNSAGSVLSGITIIASASDYGVVVDNTKNVKINDNKIVGGTNGLFAKNSAGKSSILEALTFCIFDKFSKGFKASDVINNQKNSFWCKFNFEINGEDYFIERSGEFTKRGNRTREYLLWGSIK